MEGYGGMGMEANGRRIKGMVQAGSGISAPTVAAIAKRLRSDAHRQKGNTNGNGIFQTTILQSSALSGVRTVMACEASIFRPTLEMSDHKQHKDGHASGTTVPAARGSSPSNGSRWTLSTGLLCLIALICILFWSHACVRSYIYGHASEWVHNLSRLAIVSVDQYGAPGWFIRIYDPVAIRCDTVAEWLFDKGDEAYNLCNEDGANSPDKR
jgi:hypothetical protein